MATVRLETLQNGQWVSKDMVLPVEEDFALDDQALESEMCRLGPKLVFYGDLHGELRAQLVRKKKQLEVEAAKVAQRIRSNGKKNTEGAVKEQVLLDAGYQKVAAEAVIAEKDAVKVEGFYKSLYKMADLCVALAYKQKAEIQKIGGGFH